MEDIVGLQQVGRAKKMDFIVFQGGTASLHGLTDQIIVQNILPFLSVYLTIVLSKSIKYVLFGTT